MIAKWLSPKGSPGMRELQVFTNDGLTYLGKAIINPDAASADWIEVEEPYRGQGVSQAMQEFFLSEYPELYSPDFSFEIDGPVFRIGKMKFEAYPAMIASMTKFCELHAAGGAYDTSADPV